MSNFSRTRSRDGKHDASLNRAESRLEKDAASRPDLAPPVTGSDEITIAPEVVDELRNGLDLPGTLSNEEVFDTAVKEVKKDPKAVRKRLVKSFDLLLIRLLL